MSIFNRIRDAIAQRSQARQAAAYTKHLSRTAQDIGSGRIRVEPTNRTAINRKEAS
jgi:hypothetical protein